MIHIAQYFNQGSRGGGGGNLPTTGMVLNLESDSGVTLSGSNASNWADQSGNSNDAFQSGSTSRMPLYASSDSRVNNLPSLYFNAGTDEFMDITYDATLNFSTNGFSCFIVTYPTSWFSTFAFLFGHTNGTSWTQGWGMFNYASKLRCFIDNWNVASQRVELNTPATNQIMLVKMIWDKSTISAEYRQGGVTTSGTQSYSGSMTTATSFPLQIARGGSGSYDSSQVFGQIILYDYALSSADQTSVEDYLKNKFNIS